METPTAKTITRTQQPSTPSIPSTPPNFPDLSTIQRSIAEMSSKILLPMKKRKRRKAILEQSAVTPLKRSASSLKLQSSDRLELIFDKLDGDYKTMMAKAPMAIGTFLVVWTSKPKHTAMEHFNLITEVANELAGYIPCLICRRLHLVDTGDSPSEPFRMNHYPCSASTKTSMDRTCLPSLYFDLNYTLSYRHVYMALKLSRSGCLTSPHLTQLMEPHRIAYARNKFTEVKFCATPKIVRSRFLLHLNWHITPKASKKAQPESKRLPICIHIQIGRQSLDEMTRGDLI